MKKPTHPPEQQVEALVRTYLERQAGTVDARSILAGVHQRLGQASPAAGRGRWADPRAHPRLTWGLAWAAVLFLTVLGFWHLGTGRASAESLVREAQRSLGQDTDRCYLLQIEPDRTMLARFPLLAPQHETRLWTRGDRFWIEAGPGRARWAWGRDPRGRIWIALSPELGLLFEPEELPRELAVAGDVRTVQLESLLKEMLADFDLRYADQPGSGGRTRIIQAEPKPGHHPPFLNRATLEIDSSTKAVQRVVLERTLLGQPIATVTLQLVETRRQGDSAYELAGHLGPEAVVLSRDHRPQERIGHLIKALSRSS
jgi:hypothetical protein